MLFSVIFAALAVISFLLTLWQLFVAWRFPLHQRLEKPGFHPAITILKPLKGMDSTTEECLQSWFTQDYPQGIQMLLGVASAEDPVCGMVRRLITDHPRISAQLVICEKTIGANAKVSQLAQLERLAEHNYICVSDADVWVPPDFLTNAMPPLRDCDIGMVNCLYRFAAPANLAMRWESFAVNADFWSQVLQSISLKPMDFGLGAAMLMPREQLERAGGFAKLADYLADDYQLGRRISSGGARIVLSTVPVECRAAPMPFRAVWLHQLRWARTIAACRPGAFFCTVLAIPAIWPLLWLAARPSVTSLLVAAVCLGARGVSGIYLEGKMTGRLQWSAAGMALLKDILQMAIWCLAFTGRQIDWRGVNYRVEAGGKLVRLGESGKPVMSSPHPT